MRVQAWVMPAGLTYLHALIVGGRLLVSRVLCLRSRERLLVLRKSSISS
jgi:hypothetical protein